MKEILPRVGADAYQIHSECFFSKWKSTGFFNPISRCCCNSLNMSRTGEGSRTHFLWCSHDLGMRNGETGKTQAAAGAADDVKIAGPDGNDRGLAFPPRRVRQIAMSIGKDCPWQRTAPWLLPYPAGYSQRPPGCDWQRTRKGQRADLVEANRTGVTWLAFRTPEHVISRRARRLPRAGQCVFATAIFQCIEFGE